MRDFQTQSSFLQVKCWTKRHSAIGLWKKNSTSTLFAIVWMNHSKKTKSDQPLGGCKPEGNQPPEGKRICLPLRDSCGHAATQTRCATSSHLAHLCWASDGRCQGPLKVRYKVHLHDSQQIDSGHLRWWAQHTSPASLIVIIFDHLSRMLVYQCIRHLIADLSPFSSVLYFLLSFSRVKIIQALPFGRKPDFLNPGNPYIWCRCHRRKTMPRIHGLNLPRTEWFGHRSSLKQQLGPQNITFQVVL